MSVENVFALVSTLETALSNARWWSLRPFAVLLKLTVTLVTSPLPL